MPENNHYRNSKIAKFIVALFLHVVVAIFPAYAQLPYLESNLALAEKVYLQTDSKIYTNDKTLWFKAIVLNGRSHKPSPASQVLHVELIGPGENIVDKKLIKLENGSGNGFFQFNQTYPEGLYLLRAYTEWNKNFGDDFLFGEYLQVFSSERNEKRSPISNIQLIKTDSSARSLHAQFHPTYVDSLQKRDLKVIVTTNRQSDTLLLKRDRNSYLLEYNLAAESEFVSLKMQTDNNFLYSKTVVLDPAYIDLQFLPESGELVAGVESLVGFKALDCNGKGKMVEGEIIDQEGQSIAKFKSNQLGMGTVLLHPTDANVRFYARILPAAPGYAPRTIPLPQIASKGNVLTVRNQGDEILVKAVSNYLQNDTVLFGLAQRGVVLYEIHACFKNGILEFALPAKKLPEGILVFTLKDQDSVLTERLFFNEKYNNRLKIDISAEKTVFSQREKTTLNIQTTADGNPVSSNISVLVLNNDQMGQMQDSRQNILTSFLLQSELNGEIENPGYYFRENNYMRADLDALMLTQGWRKYKYSHSVENLTYQTEKNLKISGTASGLIAQKKRKMIDLTLATFGHAPTIQTQTSDSLGRFSFNLNDEYGQNINVLLQTANKKGEKKDYTINLDKQLSPPLKFIHPSLIENVDSVIQVLVEKNIQRKKIDDIFPISSGDILLDEVVVEGYRMTPERKQTADRFGAPDKVIEGKDIETQEEKWSYGLYSVLMFKFPGKVFVKRGRDGILYARVRPTEMTLVVVDGIPVKPHEYQFVPNIPPSEVKSFEIIEGAKNFSSLYCEIFPQSCAYAPAWGDVIAIYTYGGKSIYGANRSEGILKTTIPVFSASREFYAPKYEQLRPEDWIKPDFRALVHWAPQVMTDNYGKATTTFYNADNLGKMRVVVEAYSDDGKIGYQEFEYEVDKYQIHKSE